MVKKTVNLPHSSVVWVVQTCLAVKSCGGVDVGVSCRRRGSLSCALSLPGLLLDFAVTSSGSKNGGSTCNFRDGLLLRVLKFYSSGDSVLAKAKTSSIIRKRYSLPNSRASWPWWIWGFVFFTTGLVTNPNSFWLVTIKDGWKSGFYNRFTSVVFDVILGPQRLERHIW